jgi:tetratricopeptide (TPR) repeat protein
MCDRHGHRYLAHTATLHVGRLLAEQGDVDGARAAFERAIDSAHPEVAPKAAAWLGNLLATQGDFDGMRAALERAVGAGHAEACDRAQAPDQVT